MVHQAPPAPIGLRPPYTAWKAGSRLRVLAASGGPRAAGRSRGAWAGREGEGKAGQGAGRAACREQGRERGGREEAGGQSASGRQSGHRP